MPLVPLKAGGFTDTGLRYRRNIWYRRDEWIPFIKLGVDRFYNIKQFNSDTLTVDEDFPIIAEMIVRMHVDAIKHSRIVYQFMDWLGSLGGIGSLLTKILGSFVTIWVGLHADVETIKQVFEDTSKRDPDLDKINDEDDIDG